MGIFEQIETKEYFTSIIDRQAEKIKQLEESNNYLRSNPSFIIQQIKWIIDNKKNVEDISNIKYQIDKLTPKRNELFLLLEEMNERIKYNDDICYEWILSFEKSIIETLEIIDNINNIINI